MTGHPSHPPADGGSYERDPGLAAERTELAWGRSTLALFACGAAMIKGLPKVTGGADHPAEGAFVLLLGGLIWALGLPYARARARASHTGTRHVARAIELAPLALGTAAVGIAAIVIDVFLPR